MKTLIVIQVLASGKLREIRIECAKFHAQSFEERATVTIYAQDAEGGTLAVIAGIQEAYFDKVVTHQKLLADQKGDS